MFILFAGKDYYPRGGWEDVVGVYESLEEARLVYVYESGDEYGKYEWGHIVDLENQVVVWQNQ